MIHASRSIHPLLPLQIPIHNPYTTVSVLLMSFASHDLGDLDDEIRALTDVFKSLYNYTDLEHFLIPTDVSYSAAQSRLNARIGRFARRASSRPDTLSIIYYAGHCFVNPLSQAVWSATLEEREGVAWHEAQQMLFGAQGDVLLIMDCCHASVIASGDKTARGRFELLAASAKNVLTPCGRRSFTRVLTKALRGHAEGGVTVENLTSHLREKGNLKGRYVGEVSPGGAFTDLNHCV